MRRGKIIAGILLTLAMAFVWMPACASAQTGPTDSQGAAQKKAGANVQAITVTGEEMDMSGTLVMFNKTKDHISFLLREGVAGNYKIRFYDLATGNYEETVPLSSNCKVFYDADNSAVYFSKTGRSSDYSGDTPIYTYTTGVTKVDLETQQMDTIVLDSFTLSSGTDNLVSALGVDASGRIYLATYKGKIYLFSPEGRLLCSSTYSTDEYIYDFYGFDKTNGNFYYRSSADWVDWGYHHQMACMKAGNADGSGNITVPGKNLMLLYQEDEYSRTDSCRMMNGQYLAVLSVFNGEKMVVLDSSQYSIDDYTQQQTSYDSSGNSQVSLLNIANTAAIKMQMVTAKSNYNEDGYDVSSSGPRCAISADGKTIVVKTGARELTKYDLQTNKKLLQVKTTYEPYDFAMKGDETIVLERDGSKFYVEQVDWALPSDFTAKAPANMSVGDTRQVSVSADTTMELSYSYKSETPEICTVGGRGEISAWAEGNAVITVTCNEIGVSKTLQVHVGGTQLSQSSLDYSFCSSEGALSTNIHLPNTTGRYGDVTKSYLAPDGDNMVRVEYVSGKVCIGTYDKDFHMISSKKLDPELPIFGGFFSGEDAYYLAFGKKNPQESDSAEVFRFVKYDKSWNRLGACSVRGANTHIPFDAGGMSMCEGKGMLYIHTCHEQYKSSDGIHHQSNCAFKINEATMELTDSYTGVMNFSEGYVSHSFQQKVCADENVLYRADLGDAYPRGITLTGTRLGDKFSKPYIRGTIVSIPGNVGNNYTGFALGGLACSDQSFVVAGCGVKDGNDEIRNVFVSASYKDAWKKGKVWLSANQEGGTTNVNTPKLVKLNNNQFLLMWETVKGSQYNTRMLLLGPDGAKASKAYAAPLPLSDCEPIVDSSGYVVWYVTDHSSPVFVRINPYRLASVETRSATDDSLKITQNIADMTVKLSAKQCVYSGAAKKPKVTIAGLTRGTDFKVAYKNNVKVGKASVTVTGIGNCTGTVTKTFKIVPKGTTIVRVKPAAKSMTVKWKKQRIQTTGYEILVATNSKFTLGKKTVRVTKARITSKRITKLKAQKKYFVKIRTYKIVKGVKYYSPWSKAKKIKL